MSYILMISAELHVLVSLVFLICHVTLKNTPFLCANKHACTHTHLYSFTKTHTHTHSYTNGTVIKNETTGFLKTPRTKGKSQRRSGEKSPPGNNEENDHLLFLKTRWGFTEVKLPFDVFLTRFSSVEGLVSLSYTHKHRSTHSNTHTSTCRLLISTPWALLSLRWKA